MKQRWIKASELGEYLYCHRAWWYRVQGMETANVQELVRGTSAHEQHGRGNQSVSWQRSLGFILVVAALTLVFIQLIG
jgi:hypothetical protein